MIERVAKTISLYNMFPRGERVGVAVSGGADSVCLLEVLRELAPRWELRLSVLHVNHRLRGEESDRDAEFVADLASRLGLEFECHEVDVRQISAASGDNLEQAARRVRRQFFRGFLDQGKLGRIALGHTQSDQAETVLFRFLRGSGITGLAGMRPLTPEGFARPLLCVTRAEVERYLRERGIPWREDASNSDLSFARNRIRHELLPALTRDWNPALAEILAGTATVAQAEEQYWSRVIADVTAGQLVVKPPALLFRAHWFAGLPRAIARRVARKVVERVKGDLRGIDLRHIEQIVLLASGEESSGRFQIPGLDVFRSFEWMRVMPSGLETLETRNYQVALVVPGRVRVPGTSWTVELQLLQANSENAYNREESSAESTLDWGRISGSLELRNWRPGDQYRPIGRASKTKVKSLFQEARVPLWDRRKWPVITAGEPIIWVAQFGPAADYAAAPGSHTILKVRELSDIPEFCNRPARHRRPIEKGPANPAGRRVL